MSQKTPWKIKEDKGDETPRTPPTETGIAVIGAGIAGLTTAYLLAREGKKVVVIEAGEIGGGRTHETSAHLSNALDDRYRYLENHHGAQGARFAAESHAAAIDEIERIAREEKIECDFRRVDGYLFQPPGGDPKNTDTELLATHRAGLVGVVKIPGAPLPFATGPALRFPNQAQFDPMRYLNGLAERFIGLGGIILTHTRAREISGKGPFVIACSTGTELRAQSCVIATNTPVNLVFAIHTKQVAYRTYVLGLSIPKKSVTPALFWDDADPYHYLRVLERADAETDLLIVGGEDHRTGEAPEKDPYSALEAWVRERFPASGQIEYAWSGQVMEPTDGLAYLGRCPGEEHAYLITGDSGHGLTHGTIGAMLIRDQILGLKNPWEDLYDPSRPPRSAGMRYLGDNLMTALHYRDLITPGEVSDASQINPGDGAVVREGIRKLACYRDDDGTLHVRSAICPHLDGVVRWNPLEKSWDCPCHGSRFDAYGKVLDGPANTDLPPPA